MNLLVYAIGETMSTDLNDYTIIKEGEAEILMHAKNEVFFNKTQVSKCAVFEFLFIEVSKSLQESNDLMFPQLRKYVRFLVTKRKLKFQI